MATFRVLYKTGAVDEIEAANVRDPGGFNDGERFVFEDENQSPIALAPARGVLSIVRVTPHDPPKVGDFSWEMVEDGVYEAASKVCDDGAPFRWRIGLSDKKVGSFVLGDSDSELLPEQYKHTPFDSFADAEAFAAGLESRLIEVLKREEEEAESSAS